MTADCGDLAAQRDEVGIEEVRARIARAMHVDVMAQVK
eukprot:CAMPEP_0175790566 /NCGR_PEP_ID=MMETSP0097-20121207/81985_1 /TAXON_ID=311494 /ORGANISM="Alexandrium monilatum, Strain CCMP3105" /LENGTH=37 /DNA_ID= /DNA_START= /DNA_END= /DNA_ORIENTATION=